MATDSWSLQPLGNLFPKIVVGYVGNVNKYYCEADTGVPFYRTLNIRDGHFRHDEIRYVTRAFNDKNKKSQIENGDVVIARVGANLGMTCQVTGLQGSANMANAIIIKAKDAIGADPDFFAYYLVSPMGKNQIFSGAAGGAQGVFNTKLTQEILVPNPPLPEQKKIAEILSTWDQAITATERMLENSQQRKKGLMQELLTGKKRLPRFEGEWSQQTLTEVAKVIVSPVDKKANADEKPVRLCNYTDVYYNTRIVRDMPFMEATAKDSEIQKYTLKKGDVVITKDSESPGDIAVPALIADDLNGVVCGYHLAILRAKPHRLNGAFLSYLLSMQRTRYYFFTLATGATRFGLSVAAIHNAELTLPPVPEQEAIAETLSVCDAELEAIALRLDMLKKEKKALMQQLLTGKRRVRTEAA